MKNKLGKIVKAEGKEYKVVAQKDNRGFMLLIDPDDYDEDVEISEIETEEGTVIVRKQEDKNDEKH